MARTMRHWVCGYCLRELQFESNASLTVQSIYHLLDYHADELDLSFCRYHQGAKCQNPECEYSYPVEPTDSHPGLTCPDCGHDHTRWWAAKVSHRER